MAAMGYRHVPVVNEEKQVVGVVSPRRELHFVQQHLYS
jgi:CBS domain-containing protein